MDGLRRIAFRVRHDCPVATLSAQHERVEFEVWSGHRLEVVAARVEGARRAAVQSSMEVLLSPIQVLPFRDGVIALWRPTVEPKTSISRRLEEHGLVWLQPLTVRGGWERYDAIALSAGAEQAAVDELRRDHAVRVAHRQTIGADEAAATLFLSIQSALHAPTEKQAEALLAAHAAGYYRSPRGATTSEVAARLGLGRSAFEERLRGGENRLMDAVLPALERSRSPS